MPNNDPHDIYLEPTKKICIQHTRCLREDFYIRDIVPIPPTPLPSPRDTYFDGQTPFNIELGTVRPPHQTPPPL